MHQIVITITQMTVGITNAQSVFLETEYPKLQAYLNDGYKVKETIHTIPTTATTYAVTFILEKNI